MHTIKLAWRWLSATSLSDTHVASAPIFAENNKNGLLRIKKTKPARRSPIMEPTGWNYYSELQKTFMDYHGIYDRLYCLTLANSRGIELTRRASKFHLQFNSFYYSLIWLRGTRSGNRESRNGNTPIQRASSIHNYSISATSWIAVCWEWSRVLHNVILQAAFLGASGMRHFTWTQLVSQNSKADLIILYYY